MKHFKTIPIKEKEIITFFVYMVKMGSNKLDQKNGIGNDTTWRRRGGGVVRWHRLEEDDADSVFSF